MSGGKKKVLVTGATGQVGGLLIPYLLADGSVEVVAGVRDLKKASARGDKVKHRVVLAPLTRSRSIQPNSLPGELMARLTLRNRLSRGAWLTQ